MDTNYIEELNKSQCAAVVYNDGPSLVIAGAGSGKTRVLTYKIAYLLENGYEPWNVLALTFTNKAAREMKERIARQVGEQSARKLWMGTFHSVFSRILRIEAERIGFTSQFTIYDAADSKSLLRSIIKEMELNDKVYRVDAVQSRISRAKNHLVSPQEYATNKDVYAGDMAAKMPLIRDIYQIYWNRCRQAGAMDFDDLLFYTYILFRDFPEVLEHYRNQFRYILVDEYQDTNYAQHRIVLQLTGENQRICVVGDDAQSIYSFRGADIDNILSFTKIFPNAKVFKLEQNYRSTRNIVNVANSLIEKNKSQIHKNVFSEKEEGERVSVLQAYSDVEEGEIVVNKIRGLQREYDYGYADFAILYRTNAQSRIFEEAFRRRDISYRIYGGLSFYQRKEIKDVISYFRLAVNPDDEEAFKRIINYPVRGIGNTTVGKIIGTATNNQVSLWTVICDPLIFGLSVNKGTHAKLQSFRELVEGFIEDVNKKSAYEMGVEIIHKSGIINELNQDLSPENVNRRENIQELVNAMNAFCAMRVEEGNSNILLTDFLSEVSLFTDQDSDKNDDTERVTLMTIHAAKGLEFKNVFVVGLEENILPSAMVMDSPRGLEEERRLFYVAITRAEEHCFLSFAKSRFRYGKTEMGNPSRFLKDIDSRFLCLPHETGMSRQISERADRFRKEAGQGIKQQTSTRTTLLGDRSNNGTPSGGYEERTTVPTERTTAPTVLRKLKKVTMVDDGSSSKTTAVANVQPGQTIEHERFGLGEVIRVEGSGDNAKAFIRFENAGDKQLLLRFARFKILD